MTSILKEIDEYECPTDPLKGMKQFIPKEWKNRKPITWAQAAVLRNKIKWMSIKYGDVMTKEIWDRCDEKVLVRLA